MELTIEQSLQQGVTAHREGKLEEAERLYKAILQSQPLHPDANHNLGVLAVSVNKAGAALPLFKVALEANPKIEQFWLSYIDALIKEQQFEAAKQFIQQAKKQGVAEEKLNILEAKLASINEPKLAVQNKSLSLSQQRNKLSEQKRQKKATKQNLKATTPPQSQLSSLLEHYRAGRLDDAEKLAISITNKFPKHQFGWKVLGAVLKQTGRVSESLIAKHKALELEPLDAQAHNNLGVTLQELGRLDEAEASYKQATRLKPGFAEAHNNLGGTLQELGRLDEAQASYTQAIALKPDYAEAHNNLGNTLQELGRLDEAEASYTQAIAFKPDFAEAHSNFGVIFAIKEDYDSALDSIGRAINIAPMNKKFIVLKKILKSSQSHKQHGTGFCGVGGSIFDMKLNSKPLILQRAVEPELVANLYDINTRKLDETPDTRFGNGKTTNYSLFEDNQFIMDTVVEDLMDIMKEAVESNVVIYESFFNIFRAGSGITIHNHLGKFDLIQGFNLSKQKYVLQYYLRVGDQNCSEPGVYKLYEPDEEILPSTGTIIIIPAGRMHSAVYGGDEDRVMIGINFYAL